MRTKCPVCGSESLVEDEKHEGRLPQVGNMYISCKLYSCTSGKCRQAIIWDGSSNPAKTWPKDAKGVYDKKEITVRTN